MGGVYSLTWDRVKWLGICYSVKHKYQLLHFTPNIMWIIV